MPEQPSPRSRRPRSRTAVALLAALAMTAAAVLATVSPAAAAGVRITLRVLVVTAGDPATGALTAQMDREGIPYTQVNAADHAITADFLADPSTGAGHYQAVILPNQAGGGLTAAELTALADYERNYKVRQVDAYEWPGAGVGFTSPAFSGWLDGGSITATPAASADGFAYLNPGGAVPIDDADPGRGEVYGYAGVPDLGALKPGQNLTALLSVTAPDGTSGVVAADFNDNGQEQLVVSAGLNQYMAVFDALAPGIVNWVTRGVHLGYQRNYLNVHIDDVFLPDSRWSTAGHCTPGDDCVGTTYTTPDIRMAASDVSRLVNWQNSSGVRLDMVFNAAGSDAAKADNGGSDPLTKAFLASKAQFRWINHTYSHPYLGCIQVAPTAVGQTWTCETDPTTQTPMDPEVTVAGPVGGVYYAADSYITDQITSDTARATTNALPNYTRSELVSGEHSGLAAMPQMAADNPYFAPGLSGAGITVTASDASREPDSRTLTGGTISTLPRHPMNIYYNTATYQEAVDEYNWYYTAAGGICNKNPATSTCMTTPLDASTPTAAQAGFTSYIRVREARTALTDVLTNDPRPFFAHQSNLAEDGVLYPVLDSVISGYKQIYDTSAADSGAPLVQSSMTGLATAMGNMARWNATKTGVDAYLDTQGVHVPTATVPVPLTMPLGSTGATGLDKYAGQLSGWLPAAQTVTPPTAAGGYDLTPVAMVPGAPTIGTATAGSTTATLTWTAPGSDGGSPITGYVVRVYAGTATTPTTSLTAAADATSLLVTGLTNGTAYRVDVSATNVVGTGPASALSTAVTPRLSLAPVATGVSAEAANASATVTWTPPATMSGITAFRVRTFVGSSTTALKSQQATTATLSGFGSATVTGLTNETAYTFDVSPVYGTTGTGTASARSGSVTPALAAQAASAPTVTSVVPATSSVNVTWAAPQTVLPATISGYRVRAYVDATGTSPVRTVTTTTPTTTSATITGLTNGTAYSIEVTALYGSTTGATSARSVSVVPAATAPAAPIIGTASPGSAGGAITARATWSAPPSNGGSAILGYRVTATQVDGVGTSTSAQLSSSTRSYTMTLPVTGRYSFTVVAVNAIGTSPASTTSNIVTAR